MFSEDELIPISALQHFAFCERQWGLMYLENIWDDNALTVGGAQLHEKADSADTELRGNILITRSLRIHSLQLGIVGIADIVEFHKCETISTKENYYQIDKNNVVILNNIDGYWIPLPVEYKHGKPKTDYCDEVQLCGQVMCLEEMLKVVIHKGTIYYGKPHRRYDVEITQKLRTETKILIDKLRQQYMLKQTPPPVYKKHCQSCSIFSACMPKTIASRKSAKQYLKNIIAETEKEDV